jgi:hypothetical protein
VIVVVPGIFETLEPITPDGVLEDVATEFSGADFELSFSFSVVWGAAAVPVGGAVVVVVVEGEVVVVEAFPPGDVVVVVEADELFPPLLDFELSLDSLDAKPLITEELMNIITTRKTKKDNTAKGIILSFFIFPLRFYYL